MATDYTCDVVSFIRDLFAVEGAYGPRAVIPPFLEKWLYIVFPLPDGNPAARNVGDFRSKKQGKSATAAGVALFMATRQRYAECVIAASDLEQAKDRVLRACKFGVENGPLSSHATVYRDVIEFDNGSIIQALPFDWRGAAGGNYACVVFDELHVYTLEQHRRLWDELIIPPTQNNGVRWVASYAGFENESLLLWDIWQRALAGARIDDELPIYHNPDASLLAMIDTGPESWRMPWTTGEQGARYMAEVQANERPNTFRRLWLNEWVSNESQFVSASDFDACLNLDLHRGEADADRVVLFAGVDASTKHDSTAAVLVYFDPERNKIVLFDHHIWKPMGRSLDLVGTVGEWLLKIRAQFQFGATLFDPFQLNWLNHGYRVLRPREFAQTATNQTLAAEVLSAVIAERRLSVYPGASDLREHVANAILIESPHGLRLARERSTRKVDGCVGLSLACVGVMEDRGMKRWQRAANDRVMSPALPGGAIGDVPVGVCLRVVGKYRNDAIGVEYREGQGVWVSDELAAYLRTDAPENFILEVEDEDGRN